jgi:hypothetical protein
MTFLSLFCLLYRILLITDRILPSAPPLRGHGVSGAAWDDFSKVGLAWLKPPSSAAFRRPNRAGDGAVSSLSGTLESPVDTLENSTTGGSTVL